MAKDVNHIHELENFVEGALQSLPEEFLRNSGNLNKILTIFLERLRVVDESLVRLAEYRMLSTAEGVNLDEIGNQFGIYRNGLDDEDYRAILTIRTFSPSNKGTRPELVDILNNILGENNFYTYKGDNYRFDLAVSSPCFDPETTTDEILDLLPLPTYFRMVGFDGFVFGFDGDDYAAGFGSVGDTLETDTGSFSSIIYVSTTA